MRFVVDGSDPPRTGMHARLRHATSAVHRRLERRVGLVGPALTIERYGAVLRAFFGYYAPLEARLAAAWSRTPISFVRRASRFEHDLVELGQSVDRLPMCVELPATATNADVAGSAYVLEGAALGGQVIGRELGARLGVRASLFGGDGQETDARFAEVLAWIDDTAAKGRCGDSIVAAACDTFATLERWLEHTLEAR